jgi:hypothetical protein
MKTVRQRMSESSAWTDLKTAVHSRSRMDIEAGLVLISALGLDSPVLIAEAKVRALPCGSMLSHGPPLYPRVSCVLCLVSDATTT